MNRFCALLMTLVLAVPSMAQSSTAVRNRENRKAQLEKEIEEIDRLLRDNAKESASASTRLALTQKKIANRRELLSQCDTKIASLNSSIRGKDRQIAVLQNRLNILTEHYGRLVLGAYKSRDSRHWYMFILTSENLAQAYRRYSFLRGLSSEMNTQAIQIHSLQDSLELEKSRLRSLKHEQESLRGERQKEVGRLQADEGDAKRQIAALQKDKKKFLRELSVKQKQVASLKKEIEKLIAESLKSAKTGRKGTTSKAADSSIDYALAAEFEANKGRLPWPVDGTIVDRYGRQFHPVFKTLELPFNDGVSVSVAKGTIAKCVFQGVVKKIIVMPGYNQCVLVQHGNYFTFYCKLQSVSVKAGDKVRTGSLIGTVDTIGGDTILHFEIWKGTQTQNPELWLK